MEWSIEAGLPWIFERGEVIILIQIKDGGGWLVVHNQTLTDNSFDLDASFRHLKGISLSIRLIIFWNWVQVAEIKVPLKLNLFYPRLIGLIGSKENLAMSILEDKQLFLIKHVNIVMFSTIQIKIFYQHFQNRLSR